jgi:hypothetical protein
MDTLSYRNLYNAQLLQEPNANLKVDLISTIPNHLPILIVCHPRLRQPLGPGTAGATGCSCCHGRAAQMRAVVDGSMQPSVSVNLCETNKNAILFLRLFVAC